MRDLVNDLVAEQAVLDAIVAGLSTERWETPSPAEGWLLRDCVAHLAEFDESAARVIETREFAVRAGARRDDALSAGQAEMRGWSTAQLLAYWRDAREKLAAALLPLDPKERLPWAGPAMSARSFATARLMEAWSHGLDIHDAAGVAPVDTDRLKHVAHLGYVTREFAYRTRGLEPPSTPLYLELTAPSGAAWTWGRADARDRVSGPAGDFCRVVTQRLHWRDADLKTEGEAAAEFLRVAQAFAGPPGRGRPPKKRIGDAT
ncbi:MAG TPA: TIGR03084 family metal-binding protein [Dehalococcoidia bacterium]|nr:TIGR03084 family metal-binding protein [Dehalococcoidia bacterium]